MARSGVVFLCTTKTGSSAIHQHFQRHADLVIRRPAGMKHMTAATFHQTVAPLLERYGFARTDYELTCVVRHPVDWAASWWRYRSRPQSRGRENYTGDLSFDAFAEQIAAGEVWLGSPHNFVTDAHGTVLVDRIYRYEHLDQASAWMASLLGVAAPELPTVNASPSRETAISASTRALLELHYARDLEVYESGI